MSNVEKMANREESIVVPIEQTHSLPDDERRELGLEARRKLPVAEHAAWSPRSDRKNPVDMLNQTGAGRIPELVT